MTMRAAAIPLQRRSTGSVERRPVPAAVHAVLQAPGQALDGAAREAMEARFGRDFGQVRIHADPKAATSAREVDAAAYTVGSHVVFDTGRYAPDTARGRALIAHELGHVVQQQGSSDAAPLVLGPRDDVAEREAHRAMQAVAAGFSVPPIQTHAPRSVQRMPPGDQDQIHAPLIEDYRRQHNLPPGGLDPFGNPAGPSDAEIKYGNPARAAAVAHELQAMIDGATWKEIRKRVYPKESAAGVKRAKERQQGKLADLTGLGKLATLNHFAAAVRGIQGKWSTLAVDDRVKALGNAANVELKSVDVPGFLRFDKQVTDFKAAFRPSTWGYLVSQALVTGGALDDKDAGELTNATLHEGRHAEQHFLAARFAAGVETKDEATIAAEQGIPTAIAKEAVAKKFNAGTDAATLDLGKRMNQAMITDGPANQAISNDDGLKELEQKRKEAQVILKDLNAAQNKQNIDAAVAKIEDLRKQIVVVEQKYTLYRNIPYEADAHEVGDAAEQAFKGWP
jgi:hypothetical protein